MGRVERMVMAKKSRKAICPPSSFACNSPGDPRLLARLLSFPISLPLRGTGKGMPAKQLSKRQFKVGKCYSGKRCFLDCRFWLMRSYCQWLAAEGKTEASMVNNKAKKRGCSKNDDGQEEIVVSRLWGAKY